MKKIIFMGTPDFARTVLAGLLSSADYEVVAVVTQPDRPVGRKRVLTASPVKELAVTHGIPVFQPEKIGQSEDVDTLIGLDADLIITAAYGQFVPTRLLDAPQYGSINVHASLLPKYRGGAPIHYAIWKGDQETGVSIIYMTKEMDAGDILSQRATPIRSTDTVGDLFIRLADLGTDLLLDTLPAIFNGTVNSIPQDPEQVTFSPIIKRSEEQLDWSQTAQELDWHVRGFTPFPSVYTWLDDQRVKILSGHPIVPEEVKAQGKVGEIVATTDTELIVQCGLGTYYAITKWQQSGKKPMPISQYLNGAPTNLNAMQFKFKDTL